MTRGPALPRFTADLHVGTVLWIGAAVALLASLWLSHRVAFGAAFYMDTQLHLVAKSNLHVVELSWSALADALRSDFGGGLERPLARLSLALTYYFARLDPAAYRVGNLLIHWLASLALAFLLTSTMSTPRIARSHPRLANASVPLALLAAALWGLHPIQTNVTTYVIQRMASLCGLFSFLAVGAYLRARSGEEEWSWGWGAAAAASCVLAVASKENGLTLPLLVALAEWLLLDPPRRPGVRLGLRIAGAAACLVGMWLLAWKGPAFWKSQQPLYRAMDFTPLERLLTEARLQLTYLRLLLVPDPGPLTLVAQVPLSKSLLSPPATLVSLLALGAAGVCSVAGRRRWPLTCFGVLWFVAAQLVEATVVPLELYYEHRMYVPSAFLYLGGAWLLWSLAAGSTARAAVAATLALLLLTTETWATHSRNRLWAEPVAFWDDAAVKAPEIARVHINRAQALLAAGRPAEAEVSLRTALALPNSREGFIHLQLAVIAKRRGDTAVARRELELARAAVKAKRDRAPQTEAEVDQALASFALGEKRYEEAESLLKEALAARPGSSEAWSLLGVVHLARGDTARAEEALRRAVRVDPGHARAWNNLGAVLYRAGRYGEAGQCLERAIEINPSDNEARRNLQLVRRAAGR